MGGQAWGLEMDFDGFLKMIPTTIAGALGIIGVLKDFKTKKEVSGPIEEKPKVTRWGWGAVVAILVSSALALFVQYKDIRKENDAKIKADQDRKTQTEQILDIVKGTEQTLSEVKRSQALLTSFTLDIEFVAPCDAPALKGFCDEIVLPLPFINTHFSWPSDSRKEIIDSKTVERMSVGIYRNPESNEHQKDGDLSFFISIPLAALQFKTYENASPKKVVLSQEFKPESARNNGRIVSLKDLYGTTVVFRYTSAQSNGTGNADKIFKDLPKLQPKKIRISLPDGEGVDVERGESADGDDKWIFKLPSQ
jgi:hypothetical protein